MLHSIVPPPTLKTAECVVDSLGRAVREECLSAMRHILADRKHRCHPPEMSPTTSQKSSVGSRCTGNHVPSRSLYNQYCSRLRTSLNGCQLRCWLLLVYGALTLVTVFKKSQNWALISNKCTWVHNLTTHFPYLASTPLCIASVRPEVYSCRSAVFCIV
jgi:hypothetical protein